MGKTKEINMDYSAATPLDNKVWDKMQPYFENYYGNPSSSHSLGSKPRQALEEAREKTASLVNARPEEILFTSCASEANNMAIKGAAAALKKKGNHIIASAIEHFSVLNPLRTLQKEGFDITLLPVNREGMVNPDELEAAITSQTILVSIMTANPEIGTIQPLERLTSITGPKEILFHTDATAAAGFLHLDIKKMGVDMLTLAGDQFYGPRGTGALFLGKGTRIRPLIEGGIQEKGLRAGSENIPALVGLGTAAEIAAQNLPERAKKLSALRDSLRQSLIEQIPHVHLNGHPTQRLPHNLHVAVEFVEGEAMLMHLDAAGIYVSSGSTCSSQALKSSHVLEAIGLRPELAQGSLLFTLGKDNIKEDIPYTAEHLSRIAKLLRQMSPLYQQYLHDKKQK